MSSTSKRRYPLAVILVLGLIAPMLLSSAALADDEVAWQGHGSEHISDDCVGYHWILAPGGGIHSVMFHSSDGVFPMVQKGGSGSGAWHFDSSSDIELEEGVTPFVTFEGTAHRSIKLTISHCIEDDEPVEPEGLLIVEKTANTSYDLEHFWDIAKKVETDEGHQLEDGTPKIWLYTDGSGDETATWTVDVTYEGSEESNIMVWGDIDISNAGEAAAQIDSIEDVISQPIAGDTTAVVECDEPLPVLLLAGEELSCTYEAELDAVEDGVNEVTVEGWFIPGDPFDDYPLSETADADVIFGDPDTETNATVNVKDISDLFGEVDLGQVTAPNDRSFTYDRDFTYAEYEGDCGAFRYDNTATIVETGQEADATLAVNVQCLLGETVTGDGLKWRGNVPGSPNTWFEFSPHASTTGTLIQGRPRNFAGTFTYDDVAGEICFELQNGFVFDHVSGNVKIQPLDVKPTGYLSPGQFEIHDTAPGGSTSWCTSVPEADYGYAIHLDAARPDPNFGP